MLRLSIKNESTVKIECLKAILGVFESFEALSEAKYVKNR
jgi:hypothetical protein